MNKINVRSHASNIAIINEKYLNLVNCYDDNLIPNIGVPYIYLQWTDSVWEENYFVDINNHVQQFTDEQLILIEKICKEWVQPLGQEGNPTLEQAKLYKNAKITNTFNDEVNTLVNSVSNHEMVSWNKQENEARSYVLDNTIPTPFIDVLLVSRGFGETKQELVTKIITNADAYELSYGALLGKYQSVIKQINLALTKEEVDLVVW